MWTLGPEQPDHGPAIEALHDLCFGPGRFAKSAYRLREGVAHEPALAFVAHEEGILRGSVRFWPVAVGTSRALMLGPLAVQPDQRGRGIGIALMEKGIAAAKAGGHAAIILVGDEPYYGRVGFARLPDGQVSFPGPVDEARLLGLALKPGALESLKGLIIRARLDSPVAPSSAPLAKAG